MRKIIHVDMDCFYAAVEEKFNPSLKGKPVGVGGPPNTRSVLCTANYAARKFGVRSAMPSSHAVRLCPQLVLVAPNFSLYREESKKVRKIFEKFTDRIQPLSLDEAYLDVTDCTDFHGSATLIAREIRKTIYSELKLTASAGIAPNKFLAKIASDWNKPNGQYVITPKDIDAFMPSLPVGKIYGVGKVTNNKMNQLGLFTCGDMQKWDLPELKRHFGSRAGDLYRLSRGIDNRVVETSSERKSLSVEETFNVDIRTLDEALRRLPELYADWDERLLRGNYVSKIRGHNIKMKFSDFKATTHEHSSRHKPTLADFEKLLRTAWERRGMPIRLLGIGVRLGEEASSATGIDGEPGVNLELVGTTSAVNSNYEFDLESASGAGAERGLDLFGMMNTTDGEFDLESRECVSVEAGLGSSSVTDVDVQLDLGGAIGAEERNWR